MPLEGTNPSLHELFSYDLMNEKLQDIADVLYDPNEEFQLPLDEGFRARPSIGALQCCLVFSKTIHFGKMFLKLLRVLNQEIMSKYFSRHLFLEELVLQAFHPLQELFEGWQNKRAKSKYSNRWVSDVTLFFFPKPPEEEEGLVGYSDSFIEQSKGALDYYHRIFGVRRSIFLTNFMLWVGTL